MPARRLEGLPESASPDDVRRALLAAIAQRARWRYRVLHRAAGAFDIYVVASRESYVIALGALAAAAALLLPAAGLAVARGARQAVAGALRPLERVAAETRAIGPAELSRRLTSPTGQAEVTELGEITEAMALGRDLAVSAAPSAPQWALGDADRTPHTLLNLASNAVRYTPKGSITFALESNGSMVGVSVRDTGPGIAAGHLERIFDRFFRVDQSRSRDLGGTGLGLAIARLLAELQGGHITVDSAVGAGSTFTVWLPTAQPPPGA